MPGVVRDEDIVQAISSAVRQETKGRVSAISPDDALEDDLGLDSLSVMSIVMQLEDTLGITIGDDATSQLKTVADVAALVRDVMASGN